MCEADACEYVCLSDLEAVPAVLVQPTWRVQLVEDAFVFQCFLDALLLPRGAHALKHAVNLYEIARLSLRKNRQKI